MRFFLKRFKSQLEFEVDITMVSRECAWDVVLGDHQIDHWSIVVAEVQQHARKRAMWVVRVHTLRYNCESNLNMHCAHRRYSLTLICAMAVRRSA